MTCPQRHADGAYVLGALHPAERAEFEQHLTGCPECSAAVAHLAPLPGLLGRVDPAALEQGDPDTGRLAGLIRRVVDARRRQARTRRWRLAAAALVAVGLAAGGAVAASGALDPGGGPDQDRPPAAGPSGSAQSPPDAVQMRSLAGEVPVEALVRIVDRGDAGSKVWMRCEYHDADYGDTPRTFRLMAVGSDGAEEQVGSWRAGPGDQLELTGMTRFRSDLERLELRGADGATLLVYER